MKRIMLTGARTRSRTDKVLVVGSALLLAVGLVASFASCAETEQAVGPATDGSVTLGETSTDAGVDAPADAVVDSGCEPSDPNCVSHQLSCEEAAWCPVPTSLSTLHSLTSLWGSGPNDVWAVGSGGMIIHYDGKAWEKTAPPQEATFNTFRSVWGSGPNDVWVVSMTDVILHGTGWANGGTTWTFVEGLAGQLPEQRAATTVWGTGPDDVRIGFRSRFLMVGSEFAAYNQWVKAADPDGGTSWAIAKGEGSIHGFWGTANDIWYVADNSENNGWQRGITVHGTANDAGVMVWTPVESQSTQRLEAIWGSGPDDIWAVGDNGTIRHMTNGGSRWDIVASPTMEALHGVWGSGANDVWAVGDNGTILHFDGTGWKKSTAAFAIGRKPRLAAVWGSGPNDVWIVGDSVSLHYTGPKPGVEESE